MALMDPPRNWKFTHFLTDFCRKLSDNDLAEIKVLYKGIVTEDVKTWPEMAGTLIDKGYLGQCNIVYLQKIVHHLKREDLLSLTIHYAKESEDEILYFEERRIRLDSGHDYIRVHVRGHRCQKHGDINNIRRAISEILLVDIYDVVFVGIQEANSVDVIFMIPTMYVEAFKKLLESENKDTFTAPLSQKGIDLIYLDGVRYQLNTEDGNEPIAGEKEKIWQLQRQLAQKDKQLKMMETELLLHKRNQQNTQSSDDKPNETKRPEKERKFLPDFEYKKPSKKLKTDDDLRSHLSHHQKQNQKDISSFSLKTAC